MSPVRGNCLQGRTAGFSRPQGRKYVIHLRRPRSAVLHRVTTSPPTPSGRIHLPIAHPTEGAHAAAIARALSVPGEPVRGCVRGGAARGAVVGVAHPSPGGKGPGPKVSGFA